MKPSRALALFLLASITGLSVATAQYPFLQPKVFVKKTTSAPYTGPGDVVSGAIAAYGLRAYNQAWATGNGKLVKVENTATSESCDILSASNGGLGNTANCSGASSGQAAATFCSQSGGSCAIAIWYDMSGANKCSSAPCNGTQGTISRQATIVFNFSGSTPTAQFAVSANQGYPPNAFPNTNLPLTYAAVAQRTGSAEGAIIGMSSGASGKTAFYSEFAAAGGSVTVCYTTAECATGTASDNAYHSLIGHMHTLSGTTTIIVDGHSTTGPLTGPGTSSNCGITIGGLSNNCFAGTVVTTLNGYMSELLVYSTFNSSQYNNMCHNQFSYWGTATSC